MVNVNVNFNGRDYLLACEEGQEEDLQKLTEELSKKFNQLKKDLGNLGEGKLLLITAIQVIDELYTLKTSLHKLKDHSKDLEKKFKEIKKLSVSYKDDRDKEVEELKNRLEELKKQLRKIKLTIQKF